MFGLPKEVFEAEQKAREHAEAASRLAAQAAKNDLPAHAEVNAAAAAAHSSAAAAWCSYGRALLDRRDHASARERDPR